MWGLHGPPSETRLSVVLKMSPETLQAPVAAGKCAKASEALHGEPFPDPTGKVGR